MPGQRLGTDLTLMQSLTLLREGQLHARDLADRAIEACSPRLRAYTEWAPERIQAQAAAADADYKAGLVRGPLQGVPLSVKDNIGLSGWTTRAGSDGPLPQDWQRDGPLLARLRGQQPIFTGKTHTVAFAFNSLGTSLRGEGPRNPWDPSRVCGGSSSGAAVSVAEGSALLALGTDTAGSVRVPAAMTGTVGLKVTHGRWPMEGVVPLSHSLDSMGILASSVTDVAVGMAGLEASPIDLSAREVSLAGIRIGLPTGWDWGACDPGIAEATWQALRELEVAGACLVDFDFPEAQAANTLFRSGGLVGSELELFLALKLPAWRQRLEPEMAAAVSRAGRVPVETYRRRLRDMSQLMIRAEQRLAAVDVIAMPTVPMTPPRFTEVASLDEFYAADARILAHTAFINYLRLCALSLPVGRDAVGMPVGLQFAAQGFAEARLLAISLAAEQRLGTARQRLGGAGAKTIIGDS